MQFAVLVGDPCGVVKQHTRGGDLAADALGDGRPVFGGKGGEGGGLGFVCFNFVEVFGMIVLIETRFARFQAALLLIIASTPLSHRLLRVQPLACHPP